MSNSSCKFCGEENLQWHFNVLTKKNELWDGFDIKHRCRSRKPTNESPESKAWRDLKDRLDKQGAKVYIIRK